MPIRMAKPIKAFTSSTVVVQVGDPSPGCVADMHCSAYLFARVLPIPQFTYTADTQ